MPIEWMAISAAVMPVIQKYLTGRAEKLGESYADRAFAKVYRRFVPPEKLVKANEAFVLRFGKELDSAMDLPTTLMAEPYQRALETFLCNDSVQEWIQAPLDGRSELDSDALRRTWVEMNGPDEQRLILLPD